MPPEASGAWLHIYAKAPAGVREDSMGRKNDLTRRIAMREQWIEDGHTIGKLRLANRWLAERLAEAGARPEGCEGRDYAFDELARAWVQAADIDAAMAYELGRGRA